MTLVMRREFAMPNAETFSIPPVAEVVKRWLSGKAVVVDPFARNSRWGTLRNDIDPATDAEHHMEAREFLADLAGRGVVADAVLFDPPYSPRQVAEHYRAAGREPTTEDTQNARLYKAVRDELATILRLGGVAVSAGWSSTGFGSPRGFIMRELLLVPHGAAHNDTIVLVEEKVREQGLLFSRAQTRAGLPEGERCHHHGSRLPPCAWCIAGVPEQPPIGPLPVADPPPAQPRAAAPEISEEKP